MHIYCKCINSVNVSMWSVVIVVLCMHHACLCSVLLIVQCIFIAYGQRQHVCPKLVLWQYSWCMLMVVVLQLLTATNDILYTIQMTNNIIFNSLKRNFKLFPLTPPFLPLPDVCYLEKDAGPCKLYITKWFYDQGNNKCIRFFYGGCNGNLNRFDTQEECETRCVY